MEAKFRPVLPQWELCWTESIQLAFIHNRVLLRVSYAFIFNAKELCN